MHIHVNAVASEGPEIESIGDSGIEVTGSCEPLGTELGFWARAVFAPGCRATFPARLGLVIFYTSGLVCVSQCPQALSRLQCFFGG